MSKLQEKNKNGVIEMDVREMSELEDTFQELMAKVGNHGRFQRIYNWIFVLGLSMAAAMISMNYILALNVPDHWCIVPGREQTNFTLEEWRSITLPTQKDNRGSDTYSSCQMYDANFTEVNDWNQWNSTTRKANVTVCQHGWNYDNEWYESTIPTQEHWVCAKDMFVTNAFVVGRASELIGSFVFGQMGDILGRRFVYYISLIFCSLGRLASIATTSSYIWFVIFSGIAALTVNSLFQSHMIIGMEISREQDRSTIAICQTFGWCFGTSLMPLLFWWLRNWESFMWLTTVPTAMVLIFYKYVIESPRWLISKRRFADALVQLKKIADINGKAFDISEKELRNMYAGTTKDITYGITSLFSSWRLAKNTCIMGFSWCAVGVSYYTLVLFSSRMGGNPFLSFFLQSIVEIPAYIVGKYLGKCLRLSAENDGYGDKPGRRFTNTISFLMSFLACIPIIVLATDAEYEGVMIGLASLIKFFNSVSYFTVSLQSMEIYPTCMRQTGIALGSILTNGIGILAPYLVYLGTTVDIRAPFYILGALFLAGSIATAFLPETLHKKLPDSLDEARQFGRYDKFFSLPKDTPKEDSTHEAVEKLNQPQYAP